MSHKTIANIFIFVSLLIIGVLIIRISVAGYTFWSPNIEFDKTGQIGDFIGGVVGTVISAAGFYFLYLTFNEQRKTFEKVRLENKFFDLIKLHRENVNEFSFDATNFCEDDDSLYIEKKIYVGKSVFNVIFNQFIICRNELRPFFKKQSMFKPEYEKLLTNSKYIKENNINIKTLATIDICYSIVFYGLSSEGLLILNNLFKKKYKEKFTNDILRFLSLKPANDNEILKKWMKLTNKDTRGKRNEFVEDIYTWRRTKNGLTNHPLKETIENYHNKYIKYYGGHQFRLGHYYRHLFQTVKFINNQTNINYRAKYDYIKILRAQLSTYEQAVLFFNSLSKMGATWEINPEINFTLKNFKRQDFELITKYNLVKNLPGDAIYGIKFKEFYPKIEYENEDAVKQRFKYN